jgi:hypothetical protein
MELKNDRPRLPPPWITPAAGKVDREVRPVITVSRRRPPASGGLWTFDQATTSLWLNARDPNTLFDAVTGGNPVSNGNTFARWQDKKNNGISATQPTEARRLTYNATGFNGTACVTAVEATTGKVMALPTLPLLTAAGGGVVCYTFSLASDIAYGVVATTGGHWDRFSNAISYPELLRATRIENLALSAPTTGQHIMVYIANPLGPEYTIRRDGVQIYSSTTPFTFSNNVAGIGAGSNIANAGAGGTALNGSIAEIAILPGAWQMADIFKFEGYMTHAALMSNVLPANHLYKTAAPTI